MTENRNNKSKPGEKPDWKRALTLRDGTKRNTTRRLKFNMRDNGDHLTLTPSRILKEKTNKLKGRVRLLSKIVFQAIIHSIKKTEIFDGKRNVTLVMFEQE